VQADEDADAVVITAESDGLESASVEIKAVKSEVVYLPSVKEQFLGKWRASVSLFDEMPPADIVIEDSDMNTWGIMTAGDESRFDGCGYALYRTRAQIGDVKSSLFFSEITGTHAWVYINGELKAEKMCKWGSAFEIGVDGELSSEVEITVIIQRDTEEQAIGITKSVAIIRK
jgi:hypothetical protein